MPRTRTRNPLRGSHRDGR